MISPVKPLTKEQGYLGIIIKVCTVMYILYITYCTYCTNLNNSKFYSW